MLRKPVWMLVLLLTTSALLAACAGEPFAEAYTAKGIADHISGLETTSVFDTTDDLKIVIRFNQHTKSLRLETLWFDPTGTKVGELQATLPADAEFIAIAFDLERAGLLYWQPGEWKTEIRVDGKLETTLTFDVVGEIPEEAYPETEPDGEAASENDGGYDIDNPTNPFGN